MAEIDNPQVILWCNESLRPACDKMMQELNRCIAVAALYTAQDIATLLGENDDDVILDGAAGENGDGRPVATVGKVKAAIAQLAAFKAELEANNNEIRDIYLQLAVNTMP